MTEKTIYQKASEQFRKENPTTQTLLRKKSADEKMSRIGMMRFLIFNMEKVPVLDFAPANYIKNGFERVFNEKMIDYLEIIEQEAAVYLEKEKFEVGILVDEYNQKELEEMGYYTVKIEEDFLYSMLWNVSPTNEFISKSYNDRVYANKNKENTEWLSKVQQMLKEFETREFVQGFRLVNKGLIFEGTGSFLTVKGQVDVDYLNKEVTLYVNNKSVFKKMKIEPDMNELENCFKEMIKEFEGEEALEFMINPDVDPMVKRILNVISEKMRAEKGSSNVYVFYLKEDIKKCLNENFNGMELMENYAEKEVKIIDLYEIKKMFLVIHDKLFIFDNLNGIKDARVEPAESLKRVFEAEKWKYLKEIERKINEEFENEI